MTLAVLDSLPARQREAIECRYGRELTQTETARRMDVTTRRVRYLLAAARRRLSSRHGVDLRPLPPGRPRSSTATGDAMDFDDL